MEPFVDVILESDLWDATDLVTLADRAGRAALAELSLSADGLTFCVMGCDDARIAELNGQFRGKGKPTNVLSWPSEERGAEADGGAPFPPEYGNPDDPESLGDIALAFETCQREALDAGKSLNDHLTHLLIHGLLHLLGYDHTRDQDATLMEGIETRALASLGISDPYS